MNNGLYITHYLFFVETGHALSQQKHLSQRHALSQQNADHSLLIKVAT